MPPPPTPPTPPTPPGAALGFRVKSGWATAVLLAGPKAAPRVVERRVAELSDPKRPEARQPYHAGIGRHEARAAREVTRLVKATIPNDHIRAHAEEGRLFRHVIETAARAANLRARVVVEKELYAHAARALGIPAPRLKARLAALGEAVDGPWRAEEKAATLAAWLALP